MSEVQNQATILASAKSYLERSQDILSDLRGKHELISEDHILNFEKVNHSLANRIRVVGEECRKLRIGIIGTVKAGKSSFLNALLFGGKPFLPKASTPMTATLTKLSYAEVPKAVVHFYSHDDYNIILSKAKQYDEKLTQAYNAFIAQVKEDQQKDGKDMLPNAQSSHQPMPTLEFFEQQLLFGNSAMKDLQAYKEIVQVVNKHPEILEHLGDQIVLDGDVQTKLLDYVSGSGKFTPIVSYVEYNVNDPGLMDLEIIDTPGMNDPIVSRGQKTKDFLGECDVAILLSPCGQFMDAGVIDNISRALPSAGVEKILVIGSKLDSGVRNEKFGSFPDKYNRSVHSYQKQYKNSLSVPAVTDNARKTLEKLKESEPLFISSMCYSIALKLKNNTALDSEEQKCLTDLRNSYDDFEKDEMRYLAALAGIPKVKKALEQIRENKIHIIENRNGNLLSTALREHLGILDDILADTHSRYSRLRDTDIASLRKNIQDTQRVIDGSRKHLSTVFLTTATQAEKKIISIDANIRTYLPQYQEIQVEKKVSSSTGSYRSGFLGLKRTVVTSYTTTYEASSADVANNLIAFHGKCVQLINEDFDYLCNDEQLGRQIKEIVLAAFSSSGLDFNKDDILLPLSVVLAKIKLPKLNLSCHKYIDKLNASFPNGMAQNEDVHKLKSMQSALMAEICNDLSNQLSSSGAQIKKIMDEQAASFADDISNKFEDLLNTLSKQAEDKERYLALYEALPEQIRQIRKELKEIGA